MCGGKKKKRKKMINPGCMLQRAKGMTQSPCYMLFACLFTDAAINGSNMCIADRLLNCRGSYRQIAYNGRRYV